MADRERIVAAAREIGVRDGWKTVTIRALAQRLGYAAPVLYEHFRDKEDVLTQVAAEGLSALHRKLRREAPDGSAPSVPLLAERYWSFMLEETQMYRLMNGMDGVPVDGQALASAARGICEITGEAVRQWLAAENASLADVEAVVDAIWALLHGMACLYLDRAARFSLREVQDGVLNLVMGACMRRQKLGNG